MADSKQGGAAENNASMVQTPLDRAHAAMISDMEDPSLRAAFYETLAASGLFILLEEEARGEVLDPVLISSGDNRHVLAFDTEERLADFISEPKPHGALPGSMLVKILAGKGIGILLNPGVAPSEWIIEPVAVDWLAQVLASVMPQGMEERIRRFLRPPALGPELLGHLDARLARAGGLAREAWLVGAQIEGGGEVALLVFIDPRAGSESVLARAIGEALAFCGEGDVAFDVAFLDSGDPRVKQIARHGLRIALPAPLQGEAEALAPPRRPGSDPDKPPRLR